MATETGDALARLGSIADLFLVHDRPIVRPVDDSVARLGPDGLQVLRRARGYAPLPISLRGSPYDISGECHGAWASTREEGSTGSSSLIPQLRRTANREEGFAQTEPGPFSGSPTVLAVGGHLKNAVALSLGGQVIVGAKLSDEGELRLRVHDSGVGMSKDEIAFAMQPFHQLDTAPRKQTGTGLGLPVTKALVDANRARLVLTSERGVGTSADVVFPQDRLVEP